MFDDSNAILLPMLTVLCIITLGLILDLLELCPLKQCLFPQPLSAVGIFKSQIYKNIVLIEPPIADGHAVSMGPLSKEHEQSEGAHQAD